MNDTGSENYGGPLVTDGGLLFIGASIHDRKFRAFDKRDGKLLWEAHCPFRPTPRRSPTRSTAGSTSPSIASGGKERAGSGGGVYLSFALPSRQ